MLYSGGKLTDTFLECSSPPNRACCLIDVNNLETCIRGDVEGSGARLTEAPKGWHVRTN